MTPEAVGIINWMAIMPQIVLCAVGSLVLIVSAGRQGKAGNGSLWFSVAGVVAAMVFAAIKTPGPDAFAGSLAVDGLTQLMYLLLGASALLVLLITAGYSGRWEVESGEYYALVLFATAGMMIMASGVELVTIFIGLEVASISQYILAAFRWRKSRSIEASVKYLLLGAFATGFLLYGIALTYGATGTTNLREIAEFIRTAGITGSPLLLAGIGMLLVGFGFKVSAVPFHQWTPDVYQGAPSAVTAFMASGPKVAGFAALLRLMSYAFDGARDEWTTVVWWLAVLTMTVGNFFALVQKDVKRMLAYSAIAHAGYLLVAVTVGRELAGIGTVYYLFAYALTTLGAFGVVALMKNEDDGGTGYESFAGIGFTKPWLGLGMAIFMFSLAGIPPTAGFVGKFYIFGGAIQQGFVTLAVIGVLNSVLSVYYYLRVVVMMYMRPVKGTEEHFVPANAAITAGLAIAALGILFFGLYPSPLYLAAKAAMQGLAGDAGAMGMVP